MAFSPGDVTLVKSPWTETFGRLLSAAEDNLLLASPFVKRSQTNQIRKNLQHRGIQNDIKIALLTDVRPESVLSGASDLEAIVDLGKNIRAFGLTHLPSLHAKVYIADTRMAVVTSGNLTDSGLNGNIEYGVALTGYTMVQEVRRDFEEYALLGAPISVADIDSLADELRELKGLFQKAQQSVRHQAQKAFQERFQAANLRLLKHRVKGKSPHSIFSETILFLLARGSMRTSELHPLIQRLHPDICDDSIDRVIDGVHFGKKWKHLVRNAQQYLKRQGQIRFDGERWHLAS